MKNIKIGIIGGSGLDDPNLFDNAEPIVMNTQFGSPSDALKQGKIADIPCVMLARHGKGHTKPPSDVNYRANIWALKEAGCTHILATNACGGLQENTRPGDFVVLDQFIDRTHGRQQTFYGGENKLDGVLHVPMAYPFCERTRQTILKAAENLKMPINKHGNNPEPNVPCIHDKGTAVTINGPRFSTYAESILFHKWGGDIVNMTLVPEVCLAREAGLSYASISIVTDYDCWKAGEESVSVQMVLEQFGKSIERLKILLKETVKVIGSENWDETIEKNQQLVKDSRQDSNPK